MEETLWGPTEPGNFGYEKRNNGHNKGHEHRKPKTERNMSNRADEK